MPVGGGGRDAKGGSGLVNVQARKISKSHEFENGRIFALEFGEGISVAVRQQPC
jgi:hypothetical protein